MLEDAVASVDLSSIAMFAETDTDVDAVAARYKSALSVGRADLTEAKQALGYISNADAKESLSQKDTAVISADAERLFKKYLAENNLTEDDVIGKDFMKILDYIMKNSNIDTRSVYGLSTFGVSDEVKSKCPPDLLRQVDGLLAKAGKTFDTITEPEFYSYVAKIRSQNHIEKMRSANSAKESFARFHRSFNK